MSFNRAKFRALVHYIVWRAGGRESFGATKLNKVLWFADARTYMLHGHPITGESYIRQKHGPVPQHIEAILAELIADGMLRSWTEPFEMVTIRRFTTDVAPDTSPFSAGELSVVDWWIKHVADEHTARSISELSHNYTWEIAAMGEEIPLYAVFASQIRAPLGKELEWAKAEAERLGLA